MEDIEVIKSAIIVLALNTLIKDIDLSLEEYELRLTEEEKSYLEEVRRLAETIIAETELPSEIDIPIRRPKWDK